MMKRRVSALLWGTLFIAVLPVVAAPEALHLTVTLTVENMTCSLCPITVRRALEKVEGVIEARADDKTHTATVIYDPARTNVRALTRATTDAGYPSQPRPYGEEPEEASKRGGR